MRTIPLFLLAACAARNPAPLPIPGEVVGVRHRDLQVPTASGATFEVPPGWTLSRPPPGDGTVILLEDPEKDLRVFLLESRERDPKKAIEAGWERVQPTFI
jgi:hypothetical protein